MQNLVPRPRSTHVAHFWWPFLQEKWEIHEKRWLQSCFSCISHFSCRMVHWKYVAWVLLGWGIKFCIQWVLQLKIWVNPYGDKLKIRVEKIVFFFFFPSKIWWCNLTLFYYFHYYFIISLGGPFYTSKLPD